MPTTQQKSLVLPQKGSDFVLDTTFPIPKPGKDEVLVKIKSAVLNPVDAKMRKFGLVYGGYPGILGLDIAGDIVELGDGVTTLHVGDRVFFAGSFVNEYSGFQEYALAEQNTTMLIPPSLSYDDAATLPVAISTAYLGLYNIIPHGLALKSILDDKGMGFYGGKAIFISGGSSAVGQTVIQFAKLSGFSFIITTASSKHIENLKSLGATHIVNRDISLEDLPAALKNILGSLEIETAYDAIGNADTSLAQAMAAIIPGVLIPHNGNEDDSVQCGATSNRLRGAKPVKPAKVEVLPGGLTAVAGGLDRLFNGQVSGVKLVVHPEDTA
ncbi:hypothetical protein H1R20_g7449, partial [Candolleomyces eurysporus]